MKPKTTYQIASIAFAVIFIILLLCVFAPHLVSAQSPGCGIGKTSDGRTSVKLLVTDVCSPFGAYVTHYAQAHSYQLNATYTENRATMAGALYRVCSKVIIYAGYGRFNNCLSIHDQNRRYIKQRGHCIETGAIMQLFSCGRFVFSLDASINSIQQVNTMLLFNINM